MPTSATATGVDQAAQRHREKHARWINLTPLRTRLLSSLVHESLVPGLESRGFRYVGCALGELADTIAGSDIRLERHDRVHIDSIVFNFDKYKSPRLQVHLSRRKASAPHDFIRSGNLVARSSQYYHFWGKPWWVPYRLWPETAARQTVRAINSRLDQALRFIEEGTRGSNISKEINSTGTNSGVADDA